MIARDWTKGSIWRNLVSLAWPMIIGSSLNMLGTTVDLIWVGRLGVAAMAGVGVSAMLVFVVDSLKSGLVVGVRAIVARSIGAGDTKGANHASQQSFIIVGVYSVIMVVIGIFFAAPILVLMGLEPDVVKEGAAYLRILFVGRVTMSFWLQCEAIMQATGDAITPMKVTVIFRLFHIALCPFLIFGWWLFPRMGVSGAATANVISQGMGAALGLWFLLAGHTRLRLSFKGFRFDPHMVWRIVKIAIPASINMAERSFGHTVMMLFMVPFGTLAVASHVICQRGDGFISTPAMGIGSAGGVLAAQNLGARQPERAERSGWLAFGIVEGINIFLSLAILIWPGVVVRIFSSDPDLIMVASPYLRIMVVYYLVEGGRMVMIACLNTVGDTVSALLLSLLGMWMVQVPLAYFLPRIADLGALGVRWAIAIGDIVQAVSLVTYFKLGRWKRKKV